MREKKELLSSSSPSSKSWCATAKVNTREGEVNVNTRGKNTETKGMKQFKPLGQITFTYHFKQIVKSELEAKEKDRKKREF